MWLPEIFIEKYYWLTVALNKIYQSEVAEPYTNRMMKSFIYEMMENKGQVELAKEYSLMPFDLLVLEPSRTMCEKIMSLVRFSHTENAEEDLKKKIRHVYDLHQLLIQKEIIEFFNSADFENMFLKLPMMMFIVLRITILG